MSRLCLQWSARRPLIQESLDAVDIDITGCIRIVSDGLKLLPKLRKLAGHSVVPVDHLFAGFGIREYSRRKLVLHQAFDKPATLAQSLELVFWQSNAPLY